MIGSVTLLVRRLPRELKSRVFRQPCWCESKDAVGGWYSIGIGDTWEPHAGPARMLNLARPQCRLSSRTRSAAVAAHLLDTDVLFVARGILDDDMPPLLANMSQSSLAPSAILFSAQSALANEAALLFNPALSPSHHHHQSLAAQAPRSESESLPLQGSSHCRTILNSLKLPRSDYSSLSYLILARSHLQPLFYCTPTPHILCAIKHPYSLPLSDAPASSWP